MENLELILVTITSTTILLGFLWLYFNKRDGVAVPHDLMTNPDNLMFTDRVNLGSGRTFLEYKRIASDTWNGVVGYEEFKKKVDLLNSKVDLILKEMDLQYEDEKTETHEPKLVKRKEMPITPYDLYYSFGGGGLCEVDCASQEKPKKKAKKKTTKKKKK